MTDFTFKVWARHFLNLGMKHFSKEIEEVFLSNSAIIFSPHQDDETLGCGGTIIRKRKVGADVKIVYLTDGSSSNKKLLPKEKIKAIRHNEALAANQLLGVPETSIFFLEFEARQLIHQQKAATQEVADIIREYCPVEIYIPYYRETHPDHLATNKIVLLALREVQCEVYINEYPIWFWLHWPWISVQDGNRISFSELKNSLKTNLGFYYLRDFKYFVFIDDVLDFKRAALNEYHSQMMRLIPDPRWKTLVDISNGEFLTCFFQEKEIFRRYRLEES